MGSIGASIGPNVEVGVATSNGKAYYKITTLLKNVGVHYCDLIPRGGQFVREGYEYRAASDEESDSRLKLVVTTRKERLQIPGDNVICLEDLGEDLVVAKQRFLGALYPPKSTDTFLVGIDPGERTGVAAFVNHTEIESLVLSSIEETVSRVTKLLENATQSRKTVRIGYGNPKIAVEIAKKLESRHRRELRIQFVDERGTSTLISKSRIAKKKSGTRDQMAAKLIAFREGHEFH